MFHFRPLLPSTEEVPNRQRKLFRLPPIVNTLINAHFSSLQVDFGSNHLTRSFVTANLLFLIWLSVIDIIDPSHSVGVPYAHETRDSISMKLLPSKSNNPFQYFTTDFKTIGQTESTSFWWSRCISNQTIHLQETAEPSVRFSSAWKQSNF